MTPESHHLACAWLAKARSDLATARLLINGDEPYLDHAIELSPLATEFRYPGDVFEPSGDEASHALQLAEEITDWLSNEFAVLTPP